MSNKKAKNFMEQHGTLMGVIVLSILIFFTYSCIDSTSPTKVKKTPITEVTGGETIVVEQVNTTPKPLYFISEFENNATEAIDKYNKEVIISGKVYDLQDGHLSSVNAFLEIEGTYTMIQANILNKNLDNKVSSLKVGQDIKVKCNHPSWDKYQVNIVLENCKII